jgi:hypothetical protein
VTTANREELVNDPSLKRPEAGLFGREFWGIERHQLIAGAAENLLSAAASAQVRRLLDPLTATLSDIAGWADTIKRRKPRPDDDEDTVAFLEDERNANEPNWHFVNLPAEADGYDREKYPAFTREDDVVQILRQAIGVLRDPSASDRFSELNALRLVVHLIGDVHQPVHVGCGYIDESTDPPRLVTTPKEAKGKHHDLGGNVLSLKIGGKMSNLHSYWDSRLDIEHDDSVVDDSQTEESPGHEAAREAPPSPRPRETRQLRRRFIAKLHAMAAPVDEAPVAAPAGEPEDWPAQWASETIKVARQAYQSLKIVRKVEVKKPGRKPSWSYLLSWEGQSQYEARCAPLVHRQLVLAVQHLAQLLNAIWT